MTAGQGSVEDLLAALADDSAATRDDQPRADSNGPSAPSPPQPEPITITVVAADTAAAAAAPEEVWKPADVQ